MQSKLSWLLRWTKIIGGFSALQGIVLLINAVTGFVLVRTLEKQEYAWFTVVNSLLATISILTDSGLTSAMSSIGGRVYNDRERFAELMALTRRLRLIFMTIATGIVLPVGIWMLRLNHANPLGSTLLMLAVVVSAIPAAEAAVLTAANRLHSRLRQIVQADSVMSLSRLTLVSAGASLAGIGAVAASMITAISQWLQLLVLRKQTHDLASVPHEVTGAFREPMLEVVRHMLPMCIFQCVQGQITTWVLSVFADPAAVADVGALARLGIIMTFLFLPLQNIVLPMIARAAEPVRLRRLCTLTLGGSVGMAGVIVVLGMACANPILWLLGPKYTHLHPELACYLVQIALGFLSHAAMGIAMTRGWVRLGWLHIPLTIAAQIVGAQWLDLSKATGAILFSTISNATGLLIAGFLIGRGLSAAFRVQMGRGTD